MDKNHKPLPGGGLDHVVSTLVDGFKSAARKENIEDLILLLDLPNSIGRRLLSSGLRQAVSRGGESAADARLNVVCHADIVMQTSSVCLRACVSGCLKMS